MPVFNNPYGPSYTAPPRVRALINGIPLQATVSASITTANHRTADRCSLVVCLGQDDSVYPTSWWGTDAAKNAVIEVQIGAAQVTTWGTETVDWVSMFTGVADHIHLEMAPYTANLECRDLSSRLIDTKTREVFRNQKASDVAIMLAGRHGLTADVTPTSGASGAPWEAQHQRVTLDSTASTTTEWAVLERMAQEEGYDLWVDGTTLHFHPYVAATDATAPVFQVIWQRPSQDYAFPRSNVNDLRLDRNFALAKDVKVTVKSWSGKKGKGTPVSYPPNAAKDATEYTIIRGGKSPEEALKLAENTWRDIVQHELLATFSMPGDISADSNGKPLFHARTLINISGTNTAWDTTFYVGHITRTISFDGGFFMDLEIKNQSPQGQLLVGG
jgi:phage protein D